MSEPCYECKCCADLKEELKLTEQNKRMAALETSRAVEEIGLASILKRMDKHDLMETEKRAERNADRRNWTTVAATFALATIAGSISLVVWLNSVQDRMEKRYWDETVRLDRIEKVLGVDVDDKR